MLIVCMLRIVENYCYLEYLQIVEQFVKHHLGHLFIFFSEHRHVDVAFGVGLDVGDERIGR